MCIFFFLPFLLLADTSETDNGLTEEPIIWDNSEETLSSEMIPFNYNELSCDNPFLKPVPESHVSIIATVDKTVITSKAVIERSRLITEGRYSQLSETAKLAVHQAALQGLIDDAIILNCTKNGRISTPLPEKDEDLARYLSETHNLSKDYFSDLADKFDIPFSHVMRMHRADILWRGYSARELESFQERQTTNASASTDGDELLLEEITVPCVMSASQLEASLNQAFNEGVSFGQLATSLSMSPSVFQSGHIGWLPESDLSEDIREAIAKLPVGNHTPIIQRGGHFHIYRLAGRRSRSTKEMAKRTYTATSLSIPLSTKPEEKIRQIEKMQLIRMSVSSSADLKTLAEQSEIASFEAHNNAPLAQFTTSQQDIVSNLKPHSISPVIVDPDQGQAHLIFMDDVKYGNEEKDSSRSMIDFTAIMRRLKVVLRLRMHIEILVRDWTL